MTIGRRRLSHLPALDGFRGVAVVAVLLFHAGFGWAQGGFLGVTAFFVLSGFLITSLLLVERDGTGSVDLRAFWGRRARRLVPAALVLIGLVIAYLALGARHAPIGVVGDGLAAATWVANWRFVFTHQSYAGLFSDPSPFQHMWSLAVEEQFYVVLPLLAFVLLGRGRGPARRRRFGLVVAGAVLASTVAAAALHSSGGAPGRAYYGTDTRAAEPLVGVLLALLLVGPHGWRVWSGRLRAAVLDVLGLASVAGLGALVVLVGERSDVLYRGGFLLAAVLSAVVIAAAVQEGTVVGRVLRAAPLVGAGRVSYGAYLYHWPVFLWITHRTTGLDPLPLLGVRVAVTFALATASYILIERPVRAGRIPGRIGVVGWANATVGLLAGLLVVTTGAPAPSGALLGAGPIGPAPPPPVVATSSGASTSTELATTSTSTATAHGSGVSRSRPDATTPAPASSSSTVVQPWSGAPGGDAVLGAPPAGPAPAPPNSSSSTPAAGAPSGPPPLKVAVVGDSMADGLAKGLDGWSRTHNVVVYNLAVPGCPISRGGGDRRFPNGSSFPVQDLCAWWNDPSSDRSTKFASFSPDVVVMQDGMNELPDRKLPSWPDYRHAGDPRFDSWLLNEYSAAADTFTRRGATLLNLNAVCADWETMGNSWADYTKNSDGDRRVAALDQISRTMAATGTRLGDLNAELCPNGKFTQTVAGVEDARPDGYHLSDAAAAAVATKWLGPMVLQAAGRPSPPPSS